MMTEPATNPETKQPGEESTQSVVPCQFCGTANRVDLSRADHGPTCGACSKPILLDRPIKVSTEQFQATVLESPVPVLVDFYADWCGPCRTMAPILDDIARERRGELLVVKVDIDSSSDVAVRYKVRGIPYFGRFDHGELTKTAVGAVGREGLDELIT